MRHAFVVLAALLTAGANVPGHHDDPVRADTVRTAGSGNREVPVAADTGQWVPPTRDSVAAILAERVAREQSVGLIVGWSEGGKARFVSAGHTTGPESPTPDSATVFEIGSVSKVLTTILLGDMVTRGEVALTDPVGKFLPASVKVPSRNGKQIRLVDLATVSSGLPRMPAMSPADPANPFADYGTKQLYEFLTNYTLPRDPGASYEYSNLGMGLLGHALALRHGKSYEETVRERVLAPAGLRDTRIVLTGDQRRRAAGGHDGDLEPVPDWDFDVLAGAGAWRSTAADMVRFLDVLLAAPKGPLGEAIRLTTESRFPVGPPGLSVGLGWHILERNGRRIVWHNGETFGFHAFLGFEPATGANVVVLSNTALNIDDIGMHLIDRKSPLRPIPAPRASVTVPESVLDRYVGRYRLAPDFEIAVTREGERLFVQATGQQRFRVRASSQTRFFNSQVQAEVEFVTDASGKATRLILHQGGRSTPGERVG